MHFNDIAALSIYIHDGESGKFTCRHKIEPWIGQKGDYHITRMCRVFAVQTFTLEANN